MCKHTNNQQISCTEMGLLVYPLEDIQQAANVSKFRIQFVYLCLNKIKRRCDSWQMAFI